MYHKKGVPPSNQLEVGEETQIIWTKKCMIDNWKEKQLTLLGTVSLAFYVKCSPGEDIHSHNLILIQWHVPGPALVMSV